MKENLKPCPFCGNQVELITDIPNTPADSEWEWYSIECETCGYYFCELKMDSVIAKWNKRAEVEGGN